MFDERPGTRIKVCCIQSEDEVDRAIEAGASALGLVSAMPSGPGVISDERIAALAAHISGRVTTFLLTSSIDPSVIHAQVRASGVDVVQLCDMLTPSGREQIRSRLPGVAVVQVIHVSDDSAIDEAIGAEPTSDALLLDSGNPGRNVPELGGTGRIHNWSISGKIVSAVRIPVILAGGLNPQNVASAVALVRPFGVDVCTGVRSDRTLDDEKLEAFSKAVKRADKANTQGI
jgi:phosphoribosylanthranilate isomerase